MRKVTYIPESGDLNAEVMTGNELMDATTTVVRTIARDHNTDVTFAGEGAATDGDSVILPTIDGDAKVTRRQALVVGGYANHETLHKLMTDFDRLKPRMRRWHREGRHLTKAMANAIEDVRIEHGGQVLYNGMPKAIDKTSREVNREFIDKIYPQDPSIVEDFGKIGPVAVTWEGRRRLGYPDSSLTEALDLLPKDIRKQVEKIVDATMALDHGVAGMGQVNRTKALDGSIEAAKLAERIVRQHMNKLRKQQQQEQEAKNGTGNGQQGQGQGNDANQCGGDGQPTQSGNGDDMGGTGRVRVSGDGEQGDAQGNEGDQESPSSYSNSQEIGEQQSDDDRGDGDARGSGTEGDGEAEITEPEPLNPDLDQVIKQVSAEINANRPKSSRYIVFAPGEDRIVHWRDDKRMKKHAKHFAQEYGNLKQMMSSQLGTCRRKLERVLTAMAQTYWENGKRSGRLDVRRNAARIVQFGGNVFRRRTEETAVNTALSILIDLSGSMSGDKLQLSAQASIAIAEALDPVGVPLEISGHHTCLTQKTQQAHANRQNYDPKYGRLQNIKMPIFKGYDDTLSICRSALGAIPYYSYGANADGDAIMMAAKRLLDRREERKVMLVLSDGSPAYSSETKCEHQHTRDCVEWCRANGIRIVGLGILDDSVRRYYPEYIVINNIAEFATTYVDQVAKLLVDPDGRDSELMQTNVRKGTKLA